jgi:hypothetical protein
VIHMEEIRLEGMLDNRPGITVLPEEPVYVPLVIYIGEDRRIIGDARVTGNRVECYIHPDPGNDLCEMVRKGVLQTITVSFDAPPRTPVLEGEHIRWMRNC